MYVSGLKLGLTSSDLRTMPFHRLSMMLKAWNDAASVGRDEGGVVEATQADIDALAR